MQLARMHKIDHLAPEDVRHMVEENKVLRSEIRFARESAEITAELVVKQFEETERILRRFQEANALRKAVLDSALQLAIIATDNNGIVTVFNKGAEQMLGYRAKEIIGLHSPLLFHPPLDIEAQAKAKSIETGRPVSGIDMLFAYAEQRPSIQMEWTYVRKNGSSFPVNMSINSLKDPDGNVAGLLCVATDITEKKRSEQALKESESNYRLLINSIPNVVYKGYADYTIEFFDDKIESLTGYPKEDFLSRRRLWLDLIHPDDRPLLREKFIQALRTDGYCIRQYRVFKKSGEVVWVEESSRIICNEEGRIKFITGAFLDITERKQAELALHESEEKYRSLFNSGPNPIFVLERDTLEILDANPSVEECYGYSREWLLGKKFSDLGPLEGEDISLDLFKARDWPEACIETQRARHSKKGGEPFFIKLKTCPIRYRGDDAIILELTDITDSVEKDTQLFQASKMTTLGELSAGMAHELNQPLNAIKIGNEFFKKVIQSGKMPSLDHFNTVVTEVSSQVDRASEIINRLREFGRKPDFEKDRVVINTQIHHVLGIIGQQLSLQNITVRLDLAEPLPPVLANANRLEQVIFNIITNAKDAIEQAGGDERLITIRSFFEPSRVGFSISDTGPGIPVDKREKIFEPFFTTKEVGKGVGLGLSIIYRIVRDFGGTIDLDTRVGQGTTFTFWFPAYDPK